MTHSPTDFYPYLSPLSLHFDLQSASSHMPPVKLSKLLRRTILNSSPNCAVWASLQTHFSLHSIRSKDLSPISKRSSSCVLRLNTTLTALFTRWRRSPIKKTSETYRELRVGQSHISFPPNEEPLASLASTSRSAGRAR